MLTNECPISPTATPEFNNLVTNLGREVFYRIGILPSNRSAKYLNLFFCYFQTFVNDLGTYIHSLASLVKIRKLICYFFKLYYRFRSGFVVWISIFCNVKNKKMPNQNGEKRNVNQSFTHLR